VPSPEIPGILRELGGRYRLGLLSDGYLGVQQRKLATLRPGRLLPEYCVYRFMWSGKLETESKPFDEIANLLSLEPSRIVYVADNPLGACESGIFTVRRRRQDSEYGHLDPMWDAVRADLASKSSARKRPHLKSRI
jgi:FMN phosphatase YigB (HAD superfamily)